MAAEIEGISFEVQVHHVRSPILARRNKSEETATNLGIPLTIGLS
jgi:hypothetical protein